MEVGVCGEGAGAVGVDEEEGAAGCVPALGRGVSGGWGGCQGGYWGMPGRRISGRKSGGVGE